MRHSGSRQPAYADTHREPHHVAIWKAACCGYWPVYKESMQTYSDARAYCRQSISGFDHLLGKELFIRFTTSAFRKLPSIYVFSYFPFGFEGRMWDLIVSVPDHCLSFYFEITSLGEVKGELVYLIISNLSWGHLRLGPYHCGSLGPGPRAVHKPSSWPKLRFLLLRWPLFKLRSAA